MARSTSTQVYKDLVTSGTLSRARAKVYDWLYRHGPATCNEVAVGIGERRHGSTSGRLTELRDLGVVKEDGTRVCTVSGKDIILWDVTHTGITGEVQRRESSTRMACREVLSIIREWQALQASGQPYPDCLGGIVVSRIQDVCEDAL